MDLFCTALFLDNQWQMVFCGDGFPTGVHCSGVRGWVGDLEGQLMEALLGDFLTGVDRSQLFTVFLVRGGVFFILACGCGSC